MVMRRRHRRRGMTLIEVMIALLVTTVALLGALATLGVTIRGTTFSRTATEASVLVQSQLEAMVSLPTVTATSPADNTTTSETTLDGNGITNTTSGVYQRDTTWSTTSDGLRRVVTVSVSWLDPVDNTKRHYVTASRQKDPQ
jgi:prepilin-type N-terminal cleavage/methylation domain-containing protein